MDTIKVIQSQYLAALAMLKQAIVKCPPAMWNSPGDRDRFWFKAYHTLYYTHLYLQAAREEFVPWKKHRKTVTVPLSKEETLEYLAFVEQEVIRRVPATHLKAAESGFHGIRVDKLELQFVNIRHIQQHTGELYERLGARKNIKLGWAERRHTVRAASPTGRDGGESK